MHQSASVYLSGGYNIYDVGFIFITYIFLSPFFGVCVIFTSDVSQSHMATSKNGTLPLQTVLFAKNTFCFTL